MAKPLLLDIASYFVDSGFAQGDGIDIFRDFTPESPDSLIALHEYSGEPAVAYDPNVHRSVQVLIRDYNADTAREKALSLFKSLISENHIVDFTEERWGQVYLRQPPFRISTDEKDRVTYGFNIGVTTTIE